MYTKRPKAPSGLPQAELLPAPGFRFTNSQGQEVTAESLKGKVYTLNFFFTSCPHVCPAITKNLKTAQDEFGSTGQFQMVSISVDPDTDTPEKLNAFAEKNGVDLSTWNLVRGPIEEVRTLAEVGLKIPLGSDANVHSNRAILIDKQGMIRGTFLALKPTEVERMRGEIAKIIG